MQQRLTLGTLGLLDGGAAELIIDEAIRAAAEDIDNRGEDGKPRAVNIVITLCRMDNGYVEAHVEAEAKVPKKRTASTLSKVRRSGGQTELVFQQFAPEDPDQRTIDEVTNR